VQSCPRPLPASLAHSSPCYMTPPSAELPPREERIAIAYTVRKSKSMVPMFARGTPRLL